MERQSEFRTRNSIRSLRCDVISSGCRCEFNLSPLVSYRSLGNSHIEIAAKLSPVSLVVRLEIDGYIAGMSSIYYVVVAIGIPSGKRAIQIISHLELVTCGQRGLQHKLCRVAGITHKVVSSVSLPAVHRTGQVETILKVLRRQTDYSHQRNEKRTNLFHDKK